MVAKVISGKNIKGLLNYNEHKVQEGVAQCIDASRFGMDANQLNFFDKLKRFQRLAALNPKVKTNAIHISLNFDPSDRLDAATLTAIASDYMERIGFERQPYLVYRHTDAAHPHIHIVTTNVQADGKRIDIHNIGRNQSEEARKEIEKTYKLVKAEGRGKGNTLHPVDLKKAIYGEIPTKRSISNIVSAVVRSYRFASLPELNAVLGQFNVVADRGAEGTTMHKRGGLVYSIIDKAGKRMGVPIKASAIYGKPTLLNLEKRFKLNTALRKPFRVAIKSKVDQVLATPLTKQEFTKQLAAEGIGVVFRSNQEGRVYGITFVDHKSKAVFNGSELGKRYGAGGILDRLQLQAPEKSHRHVPVIGYQPGSEAMPSLPDLHLTHLAADLLKADATDHTSPDAATRKPRKKRRKKKRRSM